VIKDGRFGPYVTDGEVNASLRKGDEVESITDQRAAELLAERRAKAPAKKKPAAKKPAAKKTPAKKTGTAAKKASTSTTTAKKAPARKTGASDPAAEE
jgi:DNA topoisomerase-1